MTSTQTLSESTIRRWAKRRGLMLQKSRSRCAEWPGHGTYRVVDTATNYVVGCGPYDSFGLSLQEAAKLIENGQ